MIKKVLAIMVFATIAFGCGNSGKTEANTENTTSNGGKVEFAKLVESPGDFLGKTISVEGKVVHVCTMSGKKLFITGENPDIRLYIQAGEEMPKFPMDLLGSSIVVEGTIQNASTFAMAGGEGMHTEGTMAATSDTCETEKALATQTALADLVMVYSKHEILK